MFDRSIRSTVALVLLVLVPFASFAAAPPGPDSVFETLQQRGVGRGIRVTEADGTNARGMIAKIDRADGSFEITPPGSTGVTRITFAQVVGIHTDSVTGKQPWTGQKRLVVIGIMLAVLAVVGTAGGGAH